MMAKYTIAGRGFKTKKAITNHVRSILYGASLGVPLGIEEFEFMRDLLNWHTTASEKVGCGVASIHVQVEQTFNTRCFYLTRIDGTSTDFSFRECLRNSTPMKNFKKACRTAIWPDIKRFRFSFFESTDKPVCPYTGERLTIRTCHVDHAPPFTFDRIVSDFITSHALDINTVKLIGPSDDNKTENVIEDEELKSAFIAYHNKHANLRVVSKRANLSDIRKESGRRV